MAKEHKKTKEKEEKNEVKDVFSPDETELFHSDEPKHNDSHSAEAPRGKQKSRFGFLGKPFRWFKKTRRRNKIIVIVLLVALAFVVMNRISAAQKPPEYTTAKAAIGDITEVVSETGTVSASGTTQIYSPTNGIVKEVFVKNGDPVITGQELITIKSSAIEQEKSQALANSLAAQNTLDTANASLYSLQALMLSEWDEFKSLAESDAYENPDGSPKYDSRAAAEYHVAEKEWIAAESNYKKQQAVISQARALVSSTNIAYQATQNAIVKATAEGTVSNLSVTSGSTVKANTPTAPTTPLAVVSNLGTTEVIISLSENDISKAEDGQDVSMEVNSVKDKKYKGRVSRVDSIGTDDNGVIKYNVYIEVLNPDEKLRSGMTADAEVTTQKLDDVLTVPNSAVKPHEGGRAVRIVGKKGEVEFVPVKVGVKGESKTEILSGISDGQEVITSLSNEKLKRGGLF